MSATTGPGDGATPAMPARRGRVPLRLVRADAPSPARAILIRILAGIAAVLLAAIPIAIAGAPIGEAYALMLRGALGSTFALSETLTRATPLVLTGLAAAIAFRARLWNIGLEGQLYAGALMVAWLGTGLIDVPYVTLPIVLACSALAGALLMVGPTWLKVRLGADEVVTTLLLNFVVLLFVQMMLEGPLKDPLGMGWPQSPSVVDSAELPGLWPRTRLHAGLVIGLVLAPLLAFVVRRTVFGFALRATGENPAAARFAGIRTGRVLLMVGALSGALAGLAGAGEVAGLKGYLTSDLSPGFGYTGIVVAMLAGLSPIGCVAAAVFIAAVFVGADSMSRALGVSSYLADLIVALSLVTILLGEAAARFRLVRGGGEGAA